MTHRTDRLPRPTRCFVAAVLCALTFSVVTGVPAWAETTLRIGTSALPSARGNPFNAMALPPLLPLYPVFDPLTVIGPDGDVEPGLLTGWENPEPTLWWLMVRDGVFFSNGQPLNAEGVAAALSYLSGDGGAIEMVAQPVDGIIDVRVTGPRTVEVTTAVPNVLLPRRLSAVMVPEPDTWQRLGREAFGGTPVGTGPYIVEQWQDSRVTYRANPRAWRAPRIDRLEILLVPEPTARVQGLRSGALDIAMDVGLEDRPAIAQSGGKVQTRRTDRILTLTLVTVKPSPVTDVRVRKALNYAVNRELITEVLLGGVTAPASQGAVPEAFGYVDDLTPFPYDPDKARALLAEAGYAGGFDLPATVTPGVRASDNAYYSQIAADLAQVGVRMDIQTAPYGQYLQYIRQEGFPGLAFGMDYSNTPGLDALWPTNLHSCAWAAAWFCEPDWMPLIEAAAAAPTVAERLERTREIVRLYREQPPGVWLWEIVTFDGIASGVRDYRAIHGRIDFSVIDKQGDS